MRSVSIVIPCRNEEGYIGRCLGSIISQDYPKELLDVFVCDGKSTDRTVSIILDFEKKDDRIHYLLNEKQSTPFALNLGIKASVSDIVIILGAHAELSPDYVKNSVAAFDVNPAIGCTGGIIENVYENSSAAIIGKAMSSSFGVGNAHFRTGLKEGMVDTVAFGAYKREVFEKAGYFDEELIRNQDDEFNFRIRKHGFLIYLAKNIRSRYFVRASYEKLFRQYYQYGYWKVYVGKKHRAVTTIRQVIPLLFVIFLFGGAFLAPLHIMAMRAYLGILVFYLFAATYFAAKKAETAGQLPKIVYAFMILHFSYGMGYLRGIIDFFILTKKIRKEESLTR